MTNKSKKSKRSKKDTKSLVLNKNIRLGLLVFIIAALTVLSYLLYSTTNNKFVAQEVPTYSYSNAAKINYSVLLLPNSLYTEKTLGEGNTYIAEYIDNINTKFKYEFNGEGPAEISGKYSVVAVVDGLLGVEKERKTVWSKEYVLQPETSFSGNNKIVSIQKDIPIKLASYNSFVQQVMEATKINFDNKLIIRWNVSIKAITDRGEIKEQLTPTMEIPLNSKFFEITGDLAPEKKGFIEETIKVISPTYQRKVIMCYGGIGICLLGLLFLLVFTGTAAITDLEEKRLKQIFKLYGNRMVALNSELAVISEGIIQVKTIDDLVRISDDIGKPILYNNHSDSNNLKKFYVIDEKLIYLLNVHSNNSKAIVIDSTDSSSAITDL